MADAPIRLSRTWRDHGGSIGAKSPKTLEDRVVRIRAIDDAAGRRDPRRWSSAKAADSRAARRGSS